VEGGGDSNNVGGEFSAKKEGNVGGGGGNGEENKEGRIRRFVALRKGGKLWAGRGHLWGRRRQETTVLTFFTPTQMGRGEGSGDRMSRERPESKKRGAHWKVLGKTRTRQPIRPRKNLPLREA